MKKPPIKKYIKIAINVLPLITAIFKSISNKKDDTGKIKYD